MEAAARHFVMLPEEEYQRLSFMEQKIDIILRVVESGAVVPAKTLPEGMDPENMTVKEAAAYTGMSVAFLNKCRSEHATTKGPDYRKQGSKVKYSQADLDRWRKEQKVSGKKTSPSALVRKYNRKRGLV